MLPPETLPPQAADLPPLLAFDTATEAMALAVHAHGRGWPLDAPGGAQASATLLPQALRLLAEAGLRPADLRFIAFGRGPGAFTGLRTACAVAQGLGYGLGCPLLPIDSLLIVAEDARVQAGIEAGAPLEVLVAMDARMDEAYAAAYRWQSGAWQTLREPALYTLPALRALVDESASGARSQVVAGTAWAAFGERLPRPAGVPWMVEAGRAAALGRLAVQAATQGGGVPAAEALPLYLRDKVALTTREREAARAAGAV